MAYRIPKKHHMEVLEWVKHNPKKWDKAYAEGKTPQLVKEIVSEKPRHIAWNISLNRKRIDTVFYNPDIKKEDVKRSLIEHDGYDSGIKLNKSRKLK